MTRAQSASITSILFVIALLMTCALPTDPSKDPDNLTVTFKLPGNSNAFAQGSEVLVGLVINYPVHADSIKVTFGEPSLKETVLFCQTKSTQAETLYVKCRYTEENAKTITVTVKLTKGTYKTFFQSINVFPKSLSVSFAAIQQTYLVQINEPITLQFPASSDPAGNTIDFRVASNPPLDSTTLKLVDEGTSARVTTTCTSLQHHKITCFANSSTKAYDTTEVVLIPYTRPSQSSTSGTATISAGTSDTLLFTIPTDGTSKLNFKLLDSILITQGVFKVLPLQSDTLKVVFTPNEVKTYTISFLVTNGTLSDTIIFQKVVTGVQVPVWKASTATIIATEGTTVSHSFAPYLTDSTRTDMVYRASKGTITGKTVSTLVPWGSAQKDSITISADSNGIVSQFKLLLNIVSGDSALPKITLLSPASNPFTTNDTKVTCKFILTDIGAGIGKVTFTKNGSAITDTSRTDSLYQCNIDSLKHGVPVIVKLVATDGSLRKNRDSLSVTITRDSTIEDKTPPTFTIVADTRVNGRVTVDTGTFRVSIEDGSGIDNGVIVKQNGTAITGVTKTGSVYSIPYTLTAYGSNTISIKATDNATSKNSDSIQISLDYNTMPSQLIPGSPANDAREIDTLPTFKWQGGSDTDHDSVFFKVLYGTIESSLSSQSSEIANVSQISLNTKLTVNTKYYWKVIGYTKGTHKDTVSLGTFNFTTVNPDRTKPVIEIVNPSVYITGMRVPSLNGSLTVRVTDNNGIDSLYYKINNGSITNVTGNGSEYAINYLLPRFGLDTITLYAVDKSPEHNSSSKLYIINCNTYLPQEISLQSPSNNSVEIDTCPEFLWDKITDPDGDKVYYRIVYSTSMDFSVANGSKTVEFSDTGIIKIPASSKLTSNTKYYYRVIGYTKDPFLDTSWSEIRNFTTFNKAPVIHLSLPSSGATRVNPLNGELQYGATDPEGGLCTYSIYLGTQKSVLTNSIFRINNVSSVSVKLSDFTGGSLTGAKKYYWCVIASDNGILTKKDTSIIDSFYTLNTPPVWSTIPSKDSTYYRCSIDLSKFCRDPEENSLTYSVVSPNNTPISRNILSCVSDSQLITLVAIDTFSIQPCTSLQVTFRRWFSNPGLMKFIPAKDSIFTMGNNGGSQGEEQPAHPVRLIRNFFMDSTEVTQADYSKQLSTNPSRFKIDQFQPVENVTWFDAVLYCNSRSKSFGLDTVYMYSSITGLPGDGCTNLQNITFDTTKNGFRLPTEAEWEYACRAGTKGLYYWNGPVGWEDDYAWTFGDTSHIVSQKKPNRFILYDMSGNVGEWCYDWYGFYSSPLQHLNPLGPETGTTRVYRGTPNFDPEQDYSSFSSSSRKGSQPSSRKYGFRCVRTIF